MSAVPAHVEKVMREQAAQFKDCPRIVVRDGTSEWLLDTKQENAVFWRRTPQVIIDSDGESHQLGSNAAWIARGKLADVKT